MEEFFDFHFSKWGGKFVFLGNLEKKDVTKLDIKDEFLRELVGIWVDFNKAGLYEEAAPLPPPQRSRSSFR